MKHAFLMIFVLLSGTLLYAKNKAPYTLSAQMTVESSSLYECAGLEFQFVNKAQKSVKSFTLNFFLSDEEGNAPNLISGCISADIYCLVEPGETLEDILSLDEYFYSEIEDVYLIEFLYVSKIIYEDDTVWEDRFGKYAVY